MGKPINTVTHDVIYRPFIKENPPSIGNSVPVDVNVEIDRFPVFCQDIKLFDTRESWSIYREGEEYIWVNAREPSEFFWAARFKRRMTTVIVYCRERFLSIADGRKLVYNPMTYPLDQFLLMYALAERGGAILHSCAVELGGGGVVLPGRSGAGKTTISRLLASRGHRMLSDDRVVVRKINDAFHAYGTPWAGEGKIAENRKLPLKGLLFLQKSDDNRLERLTPAAAFKRLMPVTSIPWFDEEVLPSALSFCESLISNIPAYDLHFRPDDAVVDLLEASAATL
ncbi:MAG: hypothetical protein KA419_18160 [Acidobacteria bacterium]|nr:hypothetical protein [Acidobacteriota bacterium]